MSDTDQCELHEVSVFGGREDTETLLRLSRSPIGDECQICPVCRSAREYINLRLAEQLGPVLPTHPTSEAALKKLQAAVQAAKASVHKPA